MIAKIIGMVFLMFVIIFASFFAVHTFATVDKNAEVGENYSGVYNSTRAITQGGISFLSILGYLVAALSLAGVTLAMLIYWGGQKKFKI